MLTQLVVKNFAVVKTLEIDFKSRMTAITGETGAGKSIAVDALGLCLGERADVNMIRTGEEKLEVTASFSLNSNQFAQSWLNEHDLTSDDECVIRRLVTAEGRSKAYINGSPVSLQQLKSLSRFLVSIHGQHSHHLFLKEDIQRQLLDDFGKHQTLQNKVLVTYEQVKGRKNELQALQLSQQSQQDRKSLLGYQVEELDDFMLAEGEFEQLETEFKKFSHSETILQKSQFSLEQLYTRDDVNALSLVKQSLDKLLEVKEHDASLGPITDMLQEAAINVEEAATELRGYVEELDIDPIRKEQVEQRYSKTIELARKHQVTPEKLAQHHLQLKNELNGLFSLQSQIDHLERECQAADEEYQQASQRLSEARQSTAPLMSKQILKHIKQMNMDKAHIEIEVNFNKQKNYSAHGQDEIQIKISPNPGQAIDRMDKVLSGGELSRVGLAIQVICSSEHGVSTMIFDEVDTGISGPTAAVVGQLLKKLGGKIQVICVTHLPQVAARADNQMYVSKMNRNHSTETSMESLSQEQRTNEIARLLAGDLISDSALANAKELLLQN
jgi:DNA repair protein RecN (Recombination protein N)